MKEDLLELLPDLRIVDVLGSSETGRQGVQTSDRARGASTGTFERSPTSVVLSEDLTHVLAPGAAEMGWLAQTGRVPRGYLGDPEKTARTFPAVNGVRHAVAGDRARVLADGSVELFGRDSVTINTGGEKVFAEEVEQAIKRHPDVFDVVVVGRPSERWGQEVVAVVQLRDGRRPERRRPARDRRRAPGSLQAARRPSSGCRWSSAARAASRTTDGRRRSRGPRDATDPSRLGRVPAFDSLRAIAVTLVLVHPPLGGVPVRPRSASAWTKSGFLGVDLFFVLSGFLITSLLLERARHAAARSGSASSTPGAPCA